MALRVTRARTPKIVVSTRPFIPIYREMLAIVHARASASSCVEVARRATACTDRDALARRLDDATAAVIVQIAELLRLRRDDCPTSAEIAHERGRAARRVVDPISLGVLKPPGEMRRRHRRRRGPVPRHAACASAGRTSASWPRRSELVRKMPGRHRRARRSTREGRAGFVLTLQAREQHIRREKATSQHLHQRGALRAAARSSTCALLGKQGLARGRRSSALRQGALRARAARCDPRRRRCGSTAPFFNEFVVDAAPAAAAVISRSCSSAGIVAGFAAGPLLPEHGQRAARRRHREAHQGARSTLLRRRRWRACRCMRQLIFEQSRPRPPRRTRCPTATCRDAPTQLVPPDAAARDAAGLPEVARARRGAPLHASCAQLNFGVDTHFYPLGSCTMKYNPKVNERVARARRASRDLHPLRSPTATRRRARSSCSDELEQLLVRDHRHGRVHAAARGGRARRADRHA